MKKKHKSLNGSCKRPSYGKMLGSDLVSGLVYVLSVGVGAGTGALIGRATTGTSKGTVVGALIGGGTGAIGGTYPALLAQRAVLREPGQCSDPSLGRLLGYNAARWGAAGTISVAARKLAPESKTIPSVTSLALLFGLPVLGLGIVKES